MVVPNLRRRGALALALAALMVLPSLAVLTADVVQAQAPPPITSDIGFNKGNATIQQDGITTQFIKNGTMRVNATVLNRGTAAANVPVHFWLTRPVGDGSTNEYVPGSAAWCVSQSLPARNSDGTPSRTDYSWTFTVPVTLEPRGHNISMTLNRAQGTAGGPPTGISFPNCPVQTLTGDLDVDNSESAYFIKDGRVDFAIDRIAWCQARGVSRACDEWLYSSTDPSDPYNRTADGSTVRSTHFRVEVINVGSYADVWDYSRNRRFDYDLKFTINGPHLPADTVLWPSQRRYNETVPGRDDWNSQDFTMVQKAGHYNVTARINPNGTFKDPDATNDVAYYNAFVLYTDMTANVTGIRTTLAEAYPFTDDPPTHLTGTVRFMNTGPAWINRTSDKAVTWKYYIDDPSRTFFLRTGSNTSIAGKAEWTSSFDFTLSTLQGQNYLAPGRHTFHVIVDADDTIFELDESDNHIVVEFFINDKAAPVFQTTPNMTLNSGGTVTTRHPYQPFFVNVKLTDDDQANLTVIANFTNVETPNTWVDIVLERAGSDVFRRYVPNFAFAGNGTSTNWTLQVRATDSSGNVANSSTAKLRLDKWPVQTLANQTIVIETTAYPSTPNDGEIPWSGSARPTFWLEIHPEMTGFSLQHNLTDNLALEFTTPNNETFTFGGEVFTARTTCTVDDGSALETKLDDTDTPDICSDIGMFTLALDKNAGKPGRWNVSLRIKDVSGETRYINRTFRVVDEAPLIHQTIISAPDRNAGQNFTVRVNASDDFDVEEVFANFTRADGRFTNLSLPWERTPAPADGRKYVHYALNITTGRNTMFGEAGSYTVNFSARDTSGNWGYPAATTAFTLNDTKRPTLIDAGAIPPLQETGSNVTFYGWASDETNVTMWLQVLRGSEELFPRVKLATQLDGNATYTHNFPKDGNYIWNIYAEDSVGQTSTPVRTGPVTIRDNLGPRFEVRSPSTVVDGERFGQAIPRIELLVYDNDGVNPDSLTFKVNGEDVAFERTVNPGSTPGYILTYITPTNSRFAHGTRVTANLTANDSSGNALAGFANMSFRVDDVAPTARVAGFEPKYHDDELHTWNVSRETVYSLAAMDDDGLPTTVASLRYRVFGPTPSNAETLYTSPFRLTDVLGDNPRPGLYQIQFFAEDSVGNVNRTVQTLTVYLDDTPPSIDPYGITPKDRYINVTFIDDRSGIGRAVVWHRTNNATWSPLAMELSAGAWRATLPEARKGDRAEYYLQAWDRVDNVAKFGDIGAPHGWYIVPNHQPVLRITAPLAGDAVPRSLDLKWNATDQDKDALTFDIALQAPGSSNFAELARIDNPDQRTYKFDTSRYADGDYTVRIRASDGVITVTEEVSFVIRHRASSVGTVASDKQTMLPGETTLITAEITKADAVTVEAHILRDGVLVNAVAMRDDGTGGDKQAGDRIYSALVTLPDAGDYRLTIVTKYREDGIEKEDTVNAATLSVNTTPAYIVSTYTSLVVLIGLAAVAALGVAGYLVYLRRR